jgi:mannosyl-oligosaccharide glucosidase
MNYTNAFSWSKSVSDPLVINDPTAWQKGISWVNHHQMNITSPTPLPLWGSYKPGIYFGMKTRQPLTLSTGILWSSGQIGINHYRHDTNTDELTQFEWIKHDGKHYGQQNLMDITQNMALNTTFIVPSYPEKFDETEKKSGRRPSWVQRINLNSIEYHGSAEKSLLFYIGLEGNKNSEINYISDIHVIDNVKKVNKECSDGFEKLYSLVTVIGRYKLTGWFRMVISLKIPCNTIVTEKTNDVDMSHVGLRVGEFSDGIIAMKDSLAYRRSSGNLFDIDGGLANEVQKNSDFLVIQARSKGVDFSVDSVLYEGINVTGVEELKELAVKEMENLWRGELNSDTSNNEKIIDSNLISSWINLHEKAFDTKFESVYKLLQKKDENGTNYFRENDVEVGKRALSSLLGGIGYFHGEPRIGNALTTLPVRVATENPAEQLEAENGYQAAVLEAARSSKETVRGSPFSLMTSTPSRTSFPRGFLWDEGFHQLVVCQWDISISMQILADWLNSMYRCNANDTNTTKNKNKNSDSHGETEESKCQGGWMPREMILGSSSEKRVPNEFVTQRVDIANPPTLMLVVESFLDMLKKGINQSGSESSIDINGEGREEKSPGKDSDKDLLILEYLHDIYPALDEWVTWLLNSQMGPIGTPGGKGPLDTEAADTSSSFRWRGRTTVDDKLIANTLASGLDDYPRSAIPSLLEYHVDLFSWMAKATAIMSRLEGVLNMYYDKMNRQGRHVFDSGYADKALRIRTRLDALHWSDKHHAYLDVGYSSDLALVVTEMIMRCGNKVEKKAMDVAVPNTMIKVS